ncbi:MAG: ATP synthase F0 subunit B [Desulfovibrionaceae bacterium]|nr:ATP synthase F0 subunit B [Desulfovibrionaceae bacterium]
MIDLDFTAIIQFVNFLITMVVLNYLLITPIRKILKQRKESMQEMQGAISMARDASEDKLENYNKSLVDYRAEATREREKLRNDALAREREITEAALAETQARLQKARSDISAQVDAAMAELKDSVPALAKEAASRILA